MKKALQIASFVSFEVFVTLMWIFWLVMQWGHVWIPIGTVFSGIVLAITFACGD